MMLLFKANVVTDFLQIGIGEFLVKCKRFHVFYNGHLKYEKAKFFLDGSPKQYKELKTKR